MAELPKALWEVRKNSEGQFKAGAAYRFNLAKHWTSTRKKTNPSKKSKPTVSTVWTSLANWSKSSYRTKQNAKGSTSPHCDATCYKTISLIES